MSEAQFGELSFFRVYSGSVKFGSELYNTARRSTEKIGQIYLLNGKMRTSVPTLSAGDIGAVVKLKDHPHGQHAVRRQEASHAAEGRISQAEHPRVPQEQRQRRGRQGRLGPGGAAPRGPDVPLHGGFRTAPDDRVRAGRAAPGSHRRQPPPPLQRARRIGRAARALSRDHQGPGRFQVSPQEADRRRRAVRRGLDAYRAQAARQRLRVHRNAVRPERGPRVRALRWRRAS